MRRLITSLILVMSLSYACVSYAGSHSVAPFAGYNPTYKIFFGAGYFYKTDYVDLDVEAVFTTAKAYQFVTRLKWRPAEKYRWFAVINSKLGFDPYYGEGSATEKPDLVDIFGKQYQLEMGFDYSLTKHTSWGIFGETRIRIEDHVTGNPGVRYFPDETTGVFGVSLRFNYLDEERNPANGFQNAWRLQVAPNLLNSNPDSWFAQLQSEFSAYLEIISRVILAANVEGAVSVGDPTYMFRYRLGGSSKLRGFHENRFRGKHYYLGQAELRFPIYGIFDGGFFAGAGAAGDDKIGPMRFAYGVGLRVGIPPDKVQKVRVDLGFAKDQWGVFVDFGHAF